MVTKRELKQMEAAKDVRFSLPSECGEDHEDDGWDWVPCGACFDELVAQAINEATMKERERCAQVAASYHTESGDDIARAIREEPTE